MMRHGFRGAAEITATLEHMAAFAHLADAVSPHLFDLYYDATLGNQDVRGFMARENPAALAAMETCFTRLHEASLWRTRRNSIAAIRMKAFVRPIERRKPLSPGVMQRFLRDVTVAGRAA